MPLSKQGELAANIDAIINTVKTGAKVSVRGYDSTGGEVNLSSGVINTAAPLVVDEGTEANAGQAVLGVDSAAIATALEKVTGPGHGSGAYFALSGPLNIDQLKGQSTHFEHTFNYDATISANSKIQLNSTTNTIELQPFADHYHQLVNGTDYLIAVQFRLESDLLEAGGHITVGLREATSGSLLEDATGTMLKYTFNAEYAKTVPPIVIAGLVMVSPDGLKVQPFISVGGPVSGVVLSGYADSGGCCFVAQAVLPDQRISPGLTQWQLDTGFNIEAGSYQVNTVGDLTHLLTEPVPALQLSDGNFTSFKDSLYLRAVNQITYNVAESDGAYKLIVRNNDATASRFYLFMVLPHSSSKLLRGRQALAALKVNTSAALSVKAYSWENLGRAILDALIPPQTDVGSWRLLYSQELTPTSAGTANEITHEFYIPAPVETKQLIIAIELPTLGSNYVFDLIKLEVYASFPFNGLSVGIQDMRPVTQEYSATYIDKFGNRPEVLLSQQSDPNDPLVLPLEVETLDKGIARIYNHHSGQIEVLANLNGFMQFSLHFVLTETAPAKTEVYLLGLVTRAGVEVVITESIKDIFLGVRTGYRDEQEVLLTHSFAVSLERGDLVRFVLARRSGDFASYGMKVSDSAQIGAIDLPRRPGCEVSLLGAAPRHVGRGVVDPSYHERQINHLFLDATALGAATLRYTLRDAGADGLILPIGSSSVETAGSLSIDHTKALITGSSGHPVEGLIKITAPGTLSISGQVFVYPGENLPAGTPAQVDFWFAHYENGTTPVKIDATLSRFTISKSDTPHPHLLEPSRVQVPSGTSDSNPYYLGLRGNASGNDYAYIESVRGAHNMLDLIVSFSPAA